MSRHSMGYLMGANLRMFMGASFRYVVKLQDYMVNHTPPVAMRTCPVKGYSWCQEELAWRNAAFPPSRRCRGREDKAEDHETQEEGAKEKRDEIRK